MSRYVSVEIEIGDDEEVVIEGRRHRVVKRAIDFDSPAVWRDWVDKYAPGLPVVTADTYTQVGQEQEIVRGREYRSSAQHPKRPVAMRGCRSALCRKYGSWRNPGCPNGLAREVLSRFLRQKRYTEVNKRALLDTLDNLRGELTRRYGATYHWHRDYPEMCINGELYYEWDIDPLQVVHIHELGAVFSKARRLDKKISKLEAA